MLKKLLRSAAVTGFFAALAIPGLAAAAPSTVVVTPANLQGWEIYTTGGSGQVSFVYDNTSPLPPGALQIDTPANADESQIYRNLTPTPISQITNMSYSAKRLAGAPHAAPAYIVGIDTDGNTATDELYAWYEPVYDSSAPTNYNQWQNYNLNTTTTPFWSFDTVDASKNQGGANGANFFTLSDVLTKYPTAKVIDLTLNVGSGTPGWSVRTDKVTFNDTTWDFQMNNVPTDKDQCKNNGYKNYTDANGDAFTNQGQCVSYVNGRGSHIVNRTTNNIKVKNKSTQSSSTGNANSNGNTTGGNATSGNASNSNSSTTTITLSNNPTF